MKRRPIRSAMLLLTVLCLLLSACSLSLNKAESSSSETKSEETKTSKASKALKSFESAFEDADGASVYELLTDGSDVAATDAETPDNAVTLQELYDTYGEDFVKRALAEDETGAEDESETETEDAFMEQGDLLSDILAYSTLTAELDEDEETVTLTLEVPDLYTYLSENDSFEDCDSSEEVYETLKDILEDGEYDTKEYELETSLVKTDDGWKLLCSSELLDALYGGLLSYYAELRWNYEYGAFEWIAEGGLRE